MPRRGFRGQEFNHVGVDIDGVLANFAQGFISRCHELGFVGCLPARWQDVNQWNFGLAKEFFSIVWKSIEDDKTFWLSLPPHKDQLEGFTFHPGVYITNRPLDLVSRKWIEYHGFPWAQVVTLPPGSSKAEACKTWGIEIFVDDYEKNFHDLNSQGIECYLLDRPWNQHVEAANLRIKTVDDVVMRTTNTFFREVVL